MNPQMQNYAGRYQSHPARPAAGGRRPGAVPHSQQAQANVHAQIQQEQLRQRNAHLEHQMAQRRARKPTDRNLPEGLEDIVIGDGVTQYKALQAAEKKLDHLMTRKRLELQDRVSVNVKREKTVRLYLSNSVSGQHWQQDVPDQFTFEDIPEPKYRLLVRGEVIDDPEDDIFAETDSEDEEDEEGVDSGEGASRPKPTKQKKQHFKLPKRHMGFYFKRISVEFVHPIPPGDPNYILDWKRSNEEVEHDAVAFNRRGDNTIQCYVCLHRDENPERFRLSKVLSETILEEEADRAEVVMGIWNYVKAMGLADDDDRRRIHCDDNLRAIFNADSILFHQVAERILPHLQPLDPIKLPFTIRMDKEFHDKQTAEGAIHTVYDVKVTAEDPLRARILHMTNNPDYHAQMRHIQELDDKIAVIIQAIHHHKARNDFFSALAKDPIGFVDKWIASQKKDLAVILGEAEKGDVAGMEFAKGGSDSVWNSEVVREAVRYRLARAEAQK